ncbi:MAG: ATP-binding protein, partial [Lentisphaeria bacterium]|nr:ATP-binding protein [Lentisphaeria bacterium]
CGMGEQTSANLFKPFFTTKLKENGKGLGLFVVNQIIENHDASVYVSSEKGQGTRICIYFPLDKKIEVGQLPKEN